MISVFCSSVSAAGAAGCARKKMALPTTPLFVKTHDFLLWLLRHTQRFPKNLRHS